jgi:putative GTP pyrophosphokinase
MAASENQELSDANIERILSEFDSMGDLLESFCVRTKDLIEVCLDDAKIQYHSVQARVKSRKKLKEKYFDPSKHYRQLSDITDLAGLRIITYYDDDIDRVVEVIKNEFELDLENCVDKRNSDPDKFAYSAVNYVCRHLKRRVTAVEYKKFTGVRCEIQMTSILRHAWSEIEHEWYDLKEEYPSNVKRRFYRLAALLELAESEFRDLRKSRTEYEKSVAVRVEAQVSDLPVEPVSMRSFIEQEILVTEIDAALVSLLNGKILIPLTDGVVERRVRAARLTGMTNVRELRDSLEKYKSRIPELVQRCRQEGLWAKPPTGSVTVTKGICIHHLGTLLVSAKGAEAFVTFAKAFDLNPNWDIDRQVAIAKEIVRNTGV